MVSAELARILLRKKTEVHYIKGKSKFYIDEMHVCIMLAFHCNIYLKASS